MAESRAKQAKPDQIKRTKRRLPADGEPLEKRSPKKPKLDHQKSGPPTSSSAGFPPKARETPPDLRIVTDQETAQGSQTNNSAVRRSRQSVDNAWVLSQGPRRSARIAARREASRVALEPKISQPRLRPRSRVKSLQPSKPHPPAEGTAVSTEAKRELRSVSRRDEAKPVGMSQRRRRRRRG
ncbi:hypothetical protein BKA56DRAFT_663374 [Ilyonectria sp. MPI-CAGE-AT-0026]|nr:hypothetical protein BKA56DRAFT_663374 [Ilyonectria sp. MPI-CAGE-AT-0026]